MRSRTGGSKVWPSIFPWEEPAGLLNHDFNEEGLEPPKEELNSAVVWIWMMTKPANITART